MQISQMNQADQYPEIITRILQDLKNAPDEVNGFSLIRSKHGVYVFRCLYGNTPAVVKYYEKEDRREILNYRILIRHDIPTVRIMAFGEESLVMEDISQSEQWRLGMPEDLDDIGVAKCLAHWYFLLHENGTAVSELDTLYFEYDGITKENLESLIEKLPEASELFLFILAGYEKLHKLLYRPAFTLTYNDFFWTNLAVRKDRQAAMMFDFNLLGRGYRYSDFRNVMSFSEKAYLAFTDEYERLYVNKHGNTRREEEQLEKRIDDVAAPLFTLIAAYEQYKFPEWAEYAKKEALDGTLLERAKDLLMCSN